MAYRIMIIGSSCAGKTTLGRELAKRLNVPQIDLDDIAWLPNWQVSTEKDLCHNVQRAIQGRDDWIITGGYRQTWDITMPPATHVIFPDPPYYILLWRLLSRTARRVVTKEKCCGDNVERLSNFFSKDSLFLWQLKGFRKKRQRYEALKANPYNPNTKFLRFNRIGDVQTVIDAL